MIGRRSTWHPTDGFPVDPYMGIYAIQYATQLKPDQKREFVISISVDSINTVWSPTAIITSRDAAQRAMRSDDVDFQRGELEWGNHNIFFDHFSYHLTSKEFRFTAADQRISSTGPPAIRQPKRNLKGITLNHPTRQILDLRQAQNAAIQRRKPSSYSCAKI